MNDDRMIHDLMIDDIEQRLRRLGSAKVQALDATRVDAIEQRLLTDSAPARRTSWIVAAAAACVLLAFGVALAMRRDDPNTLRPSTSSNNTTGSSTTLTDVSTTSVATSTTVPDTIPAASFTLSVERVGNDLQFAWRRYSGDGGARYLLIQVDADGLVSWPASDSSVAATTDDLDTTRATVTLRGQQRRRWVVVVIGDNRQLIAVSSVVTSA